MVTAQDDSAVAPSPETGAALPLVVGVTGHRDLVPDEVPGIEAAVRNLFADLAARFPDRPLQIMSPLAEGADRIVALAAEDLGIELIVPLPMPENLYYQDFESSHSWAEFGRLCGYAVKRAVVPLAPGGTEDAISDYGPERNRQYAEAGAWVASRSDILIAIWDGKTIGELGGTGHVVKFRREGEMPGYVPHASSAPSKTVTFHIVCSRRKRPGAVADALARRRGRNVRGNSAGMEKTAPRARHRRSRHPGRGRAGRDRPRLPVSVGGRGHRSPRPQGR